MINPNHEGRLRILQSIPRAGCDTCCFGEPASAECRKFRVMLAKNRFYVSCMAYESSETSSWKEIQ